MCSWQYRIWVRTSAASMDKSGSDAAAFPSAARWRQMLSREHPGAEVALLQRLRGRHNHAG